MAASSILVAGYAVVFPVTSRAPGGRIALIVIVIRQKQELMWSTYWIRRFHARTATPTINTILTCSQAPLSWAESDMTRIPGIALPVAMDNGVGVVLNATTIRRLLATIPITDLTVDNVTRSTSTPIKQL